MKKYLLPIIILASCHATPKKGEIWRNAVPYTMDVKVDSVVDNQLVMYSWDSAHTDTSTRGTLRRIGWPGDAVYIPYEFVHEIGVCSMDSFIVRGFKVVEVNGSGFINPMTTKGVLDSTDSTKGMHLVMPVGQITWTDTTLANEADTLRGRLSKDQIRRFHSAYNKGLRDARRKEQREIIEELPMAEPIPNADSGDTRIEPINQVP